MPLFTDIPYNAQQQKLDLHVPQEGFDTLLVYFHGGGLEAGSKENEAFIPDVLDRGIAVISANYRMYPQAHYPDFIEDAADCVAWAFSHIGEYGKCRRIFVGGTSAGAYLSMMLCFDDRYLGKHGIRPTDVAGYIHNAGQPTAHFRVLKEHGEDSRRIIVDERAPLYFVGLKERYAPMLFLVSDHDMENRYEQTMLMMRTLRHFGHEKNVADCQVLSGTHCQCNQRLDGSGRNEFAQIIRKFIEKQEK